MDNKWPDSDAATASSSMFYDNEASTNSAKLNSPSSCSKSSGTTKTSPSPMHSRQRSPRGFSAMLSKLKGDQKDESKHYRGDRCPRCKDLEEQVVSLSDDLSAVENELQASKEAIHVLQQQIQIGISEKKSLQKICNSKSVNDELLQVLSTHEQELGALQVKLKEHDTDRTKLMDQNEYLKCDKKSIQDEINVLKELLHVKDETVMSLTNEIFELEMEKNGRKLNYVTGASGSAIKIETSELENLRDSLKAYEVQNEYLNKEIVELNEIRNVMDQKQRQLQLKCHEWEAKCCQVQSKLLSLLKEVNQSIQSSKSEDNEREQLIANNEAIKALVNRLLEENSLDIPLSWREGNRSRTASKISSKCYDYDELGFNNRLSDDLDVLTLRANTLKAKNEELKDPESLKSFVIWKTKWDDFIGNICNHELQRNQELKQMLRSGVPQEYRPKIWRTCIHMRVKSIQNQCPENYYQNLLSQQSTDKNWDPSAKQIELDLLRTLPHNKHFESLESDGTVRLRRVLTAYSRHDKVVGYCQGLNRLAAVALLFMPEEDAFWCLVAIVQTIMPSDYYSHNLLGAHVDQYVLRDLVAEKIPRLHYHLDQIGFELSLFSWFLTIFVDNVPVNRFLRIWDVLLFEGSKVLFRFALAFLKYFEADILQMNDSASINQFIRTFGQRSCDEKSLCHIAFTLLNPFPMSKVKAKRAFYSNVVRSELEKLEEVRRKLPTHDRSFDSLSD